MSITRQIPIYYDHPRPLYDHFDPYHREHHFRDFFRDPIIHHRDSFRDHHRDSFSDHSPVPRVEPPRNARNMFQDAAYAAALAPVQSQLPLSRSFFNPERQLSSMDHDMASMANEMKRMFSEVQHLVPVDSNPDSWRVKENFHLDNPVIQDHNTGNRMFRLQFDVRQFRPEEIHVKTLGNQLTVHAKHDEKNEGKQLHREYHRQYVLPKDMNAEMLSSKLSRDGVLTIEAPLPGKALKNDHLIPIKHE